LPKPSPAEQPSEKLSWEEKWLRINCYCDDLKTLAAEVKAFCKRWWHCDKNRCVLVLVGNPGCGKTHTAKAIWKFCDSTAFSAYASGHGQTWTGARVPSTKFASWPEIAVELAGKNTSSLPELSGADLVVIDDIGAENDDWKTATSHLCSVLSAREHRFTVVTTNIGPEAWAERFDCRVADRLIRNSVIVDLRKVPSYSSR
jgi:DNA replication protein DnaC